MAARQGLASKRYGLLDVICDCDMDTPFTHDEYRGMDMLHIQKIATHRVSGYKNMKFNNKIAKLWLKYRLSSSGERYANPALAYCLYTREGVL